ncbi:SpdD-like protein [Streptomyces sp. NPDC054956]
MIRPKIPVNPLPTGRIIPLVQPTADATVEPHQGTVQACGCEHTPTATQPRVQMPTVRLTPAGLVTVVAGGAGLVMVVGAVLVSMLLAVAITGVSVAACAVVLRSLLNQNHR